MAQKIVALPADIFFDQDECKVLVAWQNKSNAKTKGKKQDRCVQTPNLREAICGGAGPGHRGQVRQRL